MTDASAQSPRTDGFELADAIAARVLDAVPLRVGAARSASEIEATQRLRADGMVEMGWVSEDELPDGLERDAHDKRAIHIGAWDGEELVGTSRVVPPDSGGGLPIEDHFGVALSPRGELVEVGRTVIVPAHRGDSHHALVIAIFAQCWREMRSIGYSELVANLPSKLIDVYRGVGFEIEVLGPGRAIWGEKRCPVRFDVWRSAESMAATWLGHT